MKRLQFIRRARALGLPLASIVVMLELSEQRDEPCAVIDQIVRTHRDDIDSCIRSQNNTDSSHVGSSILLPVARIWGRHPLQVTG
ncbi:MerR family DNA-binding protein [Aureimonas altamirensis]|uniref:MerR family DNA-binding protein n=1 Tax=Aureimonas altamirensis TaxID=370622 RepID=UPI00333BD5EB